MKVITQLVQHFWQRNALTADQAEYLVNQGFVRAGDLPGFEPSTPAQSGADQPSSFKFKVPVKPPHPLESVQEKLQNRPAAKRVRGKAPVKSLTEKDLAKLVEKELAARAASLEVFRRWASGFGAADTWVDGAVRVRQATPARVADGLSKSLRANSARLGDLWTALDLEPLYALIDGDDFQGLVPRAFRALLSTDGPLSAPHIFLLKLEPLAAVKSLGTAHRRLRTAVVTLFDQQGKTITEGLKQGNHPVLFWALILLYNSRRKPIDGPTRPRREYGPLPLPHALVWRQAWATALAMDSPVVTELLIRCYEDGSDSRKRDPVVCQFPLHCPLDWRAP